MVRQYRVMWRYRSGLGGPWMEGDLVEMDEGEAEAVNRDSPGVLVDVRTKPEGRKPGKQDRMVKKAEGRMGDE